MAPSTSSPTSHPDRTSTQPSSSPFESPSSSSSLGPRFASPKALHMVDITYPESFMRTPLPLLPFDAPKWLLEYGRSAGIAGRESITEFDDDDEADDVRESIEPREELISVTKKDIWGDGKREWSGYTYSTIPLPSTSTSTSTRTRTRKRRCDSSSPDITTTHPSQKLKRS